VAFARYIAYLRPSSLNLTGSSNSTADWLDRFKRYIEGGKTIVVSPHKVFGPQTNDLVPQLRKRGIGKIILGGMLANMSRPICASLAGPRGCSSQGRNRWTSASGMGRRLSCGHHQLPIPCACRVVDR